MQTNIIWKSLDFLLLFENMMSERGSIIMSKVSILFHMENYSRFLCHIDKIKLFILKLWHKCVKDILLHMGVAFLMKGMPIHTFVLRKPTHGDIHTVSSWKIQPEKVAHFKNWLTNILIKKELCSLCFLHSDIKMTANCDYLFKQIS